MTMQSPTTSNPDQSDRARRQINASIYDQPDYLSERTARLIAAAVHPGEGSALAHYASTGERRSGMLDELGTLQLSVEHSIWRDLLEMRLTANEDINQ
ncbi:hypothetical protein [Cryobacterium sp. GrIS_2_6]|uniref:hypothetical protein n=1 Tax=Cryobacterium sp. GrIS_2_6 TaxID=3162785 RepID=UPI002E0C23D8|nr:hypothetical protein [Cryobacterium psychrotolerans]